MAHTKHDPARSEWHAAWAAVRVGPGLLSLWPGYRETDVETVYLARDVWQSRLAGPTPKPGIRGRFLRWGLRPSAPLPLP